jgi:hypothetical protein
MRTETRRLLEKKPGLYVANDLLRPYLPPRLGTLLLVSYRDDRAILSVFFFWVFFARGAAAISQKRQRVALETFCKNAFVLSYDD